MDDLSADEMLLNDLFDDRWVARSIPDPLGIDDSNRPSLTHPEAVGLRAEDATSLGEPKLTQPSFKVVPRRQPTCLVATFWFCLVGTEQDVTCRGGHTDRGRDSSLTHKRPGGRFVLTHVLKDGGRERQWTCRIARS